MAQNRKPLNSGIDWEGAPGFLGGIKALFSTSGHVLFRPMDFFKTLIALNGVDVARRLKRAVIFAIVLGYIKLFLELANLFGLSRFSGHIFTFFTAERMPFWTAGALGSFLFLLRPVFIFVVTFILIALSIKLVLGPDKTLLPALFVVCYKSAAELFYCIPVIGGFLAAVWSLVLITLGVSCVYRIGNTRAVLSVLVVPFMILFFLLTAAGPSLQRALFSFYPETRSQVVKLNDITAYASCASIVSALKTYKKELGFYPHGLGNLRKYLSGEVIDVVFDRRQAAGYRYSYQYVDDNNFILEARPVKLNDSGRFAFYADQGGEIHLGGLAGPKIENTEQIKDLVGGVQ